MVKMEFTVIKVGAHFLNKLNVLYIGAVHEFWFENGAFKIEMKRQLEL